MEVNTEGLSGCAGRTTASHSNSNLYLVSIRKQGEAEQLALVDNLKEQEHRLIAEVMMYKQVRGLTSTGYCWT